VLRRALRRTRHARALAGRAQRRSRPAAVRRQATQAQTLHRHVHHDRPGAQRAGHQRPAAPAGHLRAVRQVCPRPRRAPAARDTRANLLSCRGSRASLPPPAPVRPPAPGLQGPGRAAPPAPAQPRRGRSGRGSCTGARSNGASARRGLASARFHSSLGWASTCGLLGGSPLRGAAARSAAFLVPEVVWPGVPHLGPGSAPPLPLPQPHLAHLHPLVQARARPGLRAARLAVKRPAGREWAARWRAGPRR